MDPNVKPLEVQVVALDWKWMFIYPSEELPRSINWLRLWTSDPLQAYRLAHRSAFYVPDLAG